MTGSEISKRVAKQLKIAPREMAHFISKNRVVLSSLAVVIAGVAYMEDPHSEGIVSLIDHTAAGLLHLTGGGPLPAPDGLTEIFKDQQKLNDFLPIATKSFGLGLIGIAIRSWMGLRDERMRLGIEPVHWLDSPDHVYIGPGAIATDLANSRANGSKRRWFNKNTTVSIHIASPTPAGFGHNITHHFSPAKPDDIVGAFPGRPDKSFIEITGLDRAKEITFICFNPNNALFYGSSSELQINPSYITSILKKIPPENIKGRIVNVIVNDTFYLGNTTSIEKDLKKAERELGFKLNIINPEKKIVENIGKVVTTEDVKNILIVGLGEKPADQAMLNRFGKRLEALQPGLKVTLLSNEQEMTEEQLNASLEAAELCLCYGDSDQATTTLVSLLEDRGYPLDQIIALAERVGNRFDFDGLKIKKYWVVDEEILKEMNRLNQKSSEGI